MAEPAVLPRRRPGQLWRWRCVDPDGTLVADHVCVLMRRMPEIWFWASLPRAVPPGEIWKALVARIVPPVPACLSAVVFEQPAGLSSSSIGTSSWELLDQAPGS